ncbi:uncharacterized protein LOC134219677 [Armigeres subalbatus]|uniref:uncharacterized protein LOC134219677 n=1 Tax=Armigeres subalbatus TaxID=124917 RepID=UPI002ED689E7
MKEHRELVVCLLLLVGVYAAPSPCENLKELPICNETQYEAYRSCVEEVKSLRIARQTQCPQLYAAARPTVVESNAVQQAKTDTSLSDVVEPSIDIIPALQSVVTVKPVECNHSLDNTPMLKSLNRKMIVQMEDEDYEYQVPTNITTVIRLTNVVNNTNIVNVPTHVNTTNVNNIHVYANITEGDSALKQDEPRCCTAVQPKSCHMSTQGYRCKHKKFKTCGTQCTADIVHVQRRKRCDGHGNCKQKIAYVPQPEKPTCVYVEQWPFVVCGKPANMQVVCDGCYDHYGQGLEALHGQLPNQCRGCYDDAFNQGPLYRRGPVLRPFYYHEPPCYITGTCPMSYGDCGYGCYGHEMVDPAWGVQPSYEQSPYDPVMNEVNSAYLSHELETANDTENDWGVPVHKCTVVSDDNTISVQNCTNVVENQYAAAPSNYPYYKVPQEVRKPYKVRQTMQRQQMIEEIEEMDPSSGDGVIIQSSQASFVNDDDSYYYDYSQ